MSASSLIREARRAAGLTQAQLAARAGTSQPAVARYESGAASPSIRTLERLLRAAGQRVQLGSEPVEQSADLGGVRMRRLRKHRAQIERAVRQAGARNVRVFGSVARGQDQPDSDIDLLVDFDVRAHGGIPLIRLRRVLSQLLGERVDVVTADLLRAGDSGPGNRRSGAVVTARASRHRRPAPRHPDRSRPSQAS